MKKYFFLLLLVLPLAPMACTGSGAVNPLSPTSASKQDPSDVAPDSAVLYWTSFPVTFDITDPLNGVCMTSKKSGWACGNNGLVLQYDGDTWSKVKTGLAPNENLMSVSFDTPNEGWVTGTHGIILYYQNGSWSQQVSPTSETLNDVVAGNNHVVWAVGTNGTILQFNGVSWAQMPVTDATGAAVKADLYGISFSDPNNGWACGDQGTILKFDGQKWTLFSASPTTEKLNSVSVISSVQAWIVGAFGTLLSFNGTTWSKVVGPNASVDLYNVSMRNDSDGWAVGQNGTILYYDGTRWIPHPSPLGKPSLNAVAFSDNAGFIVGQNGTILKFVPDGQSAVYNFLFKGVVASTPTKDDPYWTVNYTIMNQGTQGVTAITFELPVPKGLEPYRKTLSVPATPMASATAVANPPTATPTLTPTPQLVGTATPGANGVVKTSAVSGLWTLKDNGKLNWIIGNIDPSELKTMTLLFADKKNESKDYPVILKAVLKSNDNEVYEAQPVTVQASPITAVSTPLPTPTAVH